MPRDSMFLGDLVSSFFILFLLSSLIADAVFFLVFLPPRHQNIFHLVKFNVKIKC